MTVSRVVKNHNRLISRDINIDKIIMEQYACNTTDTILEICNKINSLENVNNTTKYSLALENISHSLETTNKYYDIDSISKLITEYFMYNGICESEEIESLLEKVSLKKKPDKSKIKELLKRFPDENIKSKSFVTSLVTKFYTLSKDNIIEETPNFLTWIRKGIVFSTLAVNPYLGILNIFIDYFIEMTLKRSEIKKMISKLEQEKKNIENSKSKAKGDNLVKDLDKYMDEIDKNIDKLKNYEESLYSNDELMSKDDDDDFTLESTIDNLSIHSKEDYLNNYHNLFVGEIKKARKKIEEVVNSTLSKYTKKEMFILTTENEFGQFTNMDSDNIYDYLDSNNRVSFPVLECLPYNYFKEEHRTETSDIFVKLMENVNTILDEHVHLTMEGNDDKYLFNIVLNIPIEESFNKNDMNIELKKDLAMILALAEQVEELSNKKIDSLFTNIKEDFICESNLNYLISFNDKYNQILDTDIIKESLLGIKEDIYNNYDSIKATRMGSLIQESIYQLSKPKKSFLVPKNRYEILMETIEINQGLNILNELSLGNKVKVAQQNLVKNMKNLSDKEKVLSKQMDNALDKFYNNVEKELTNKNREKVIKGSILPSASSIIKLAVVSGVAFMINPALAVITVLGSIAVSKSATSKEKQYILDEINIMLKMVDKKIQLAENNNDMKALEQLLRTQQKLERERQRIHYNLRRRNYPVTRVSNND